MNKINLLSKGDYIPKRRYIPAVKWEKYYDYPSLASIRHLTFSNKNGFRDKVVKYSGRRVLLDEEAFISWIEEQNEEK